MTATAYQVITEDTATAFYPLFSSLAAMKLQPVGNLRDLALYTSQYNFTLDYQAVPSSVRELAVETEMEVDGRWIAEIPDIPGALAYGLSRETAVQNVQHLASRVLNSEPRGGVMHPEFYQTILIPDA